MRGYRFGGPRSGGPTCRFFSLQKCDHGSDRKLGEVCLSEWVQNQLVPRSQLQSRLPVYPRLDSEFLRMDS